MVLSALYTIMYFINNEGELKAYQITHRQV